MGTGTGKVGWTFGHPPGNGVKTTFIQHMVIMPGSRWCVGAGMVNKKGLIETQEHCGTCSKKLHMCDRGHYVCTHCRVPHDCRGVRQLKSVKGLYTRKKPS